VPPDAVLLIEDLTDHQVTRHDLRPDLYPREQIAA
jgi:DNA-binding transcriptional regulator YdaS (Cro superfamily)